MKSIGFITTTIFGLSAGVFFPVELFPPPFDNLAYVLPLTQGLTLMREMLLFPNLLPNMNLLFMLLSETIILFISTIILYKKILNLIGSRNCDWKYNKEFEQSYFNYYGLLTNIDFYYLSYLVLINWDSKHIF